MQKNPTVVGFYRLAMKEAVIILGHQLFGIMKRIKPKVRSDFI